MIEFLNQLDPTLYLTIHSIVCALRNQPYPNKGFWHGFYYYVSSYVNDKESMNYNQCLSYINNVSA